MKILGLSGVPLLLSGGFAFAQETGGLELTFDLSQRFEYNEESGFASSDDEGFRSITGLGFGLTTATRGRSLTFGVVTNIAQNLSESASTEFEDTRVDLDYILSNRNSELAFELDYRRDEVDDLAFDTATFLDTDITTGEGQREILGFATRLELGREGPVSGSFRYGYEKSVYSDILDPSLNDSDTERFDGRVNVQVSPTVTASVFGSRSEVDEDGAGATDRTFTRYGVGATYVISPATLVTGEIFVTEEDSRTATTFTEVDGLGYAFTIENQRPNGVLNARFFETETLNGKRRELLVGRSYELQRGSFSFTAGATKTEGFDVEPLVNVALDYELDKQSQIRVALDQRAAVNDDDSTVVNTRLDVSYTRTLTSLSEIAAGFALVDENVLGATSDEQSMRLDLSHRYELSRDWDLVSGVEYSSIDEEGVPRRERHSIFVGLERSFSVRP